MGSELIVLLVAVGTLFAGVAGSMARASRRGSRWQQEAQRRWGEVAEALGGELEVSSGGSLTPLGLRLTVILDSAPALVQTKVPVDPGSMAYTRASARFVIGSGPRFRADERGAPAPEGTESILTDPALVRRVRMDTAQPEAVRAVFSEELCARAARFRRRLALRSDGRCVELVWDGVELDPAVLEEAVRLVSAIAHAGSGPLADLAKLPGAHLEATEDGWSVDVERGAAVVSLRASLGRAGPVYRASARMERELPPFEARVEPDGELTGDVPAAAIEPHEVDRLAQVGPCRLSVDEQRAELIWDEPPSRARAEAATHVVAALATGGGRRGAFR